MLTHPIVPRDQAEFFLNIMAELSEVVTIPERLSICKDPGDDIFLETAVVGGANFLVTKNIRHFPRKNYQQVEIVRVSMFLSHLEKQFEKSNK